MHIHAEDKKFFKNKFLSSESINKPSILSKVSVFVTNSYIPSPEEMGTTLYGVRNVFLFSSF
jgi:hypothetical protein